MKRLPLADFARAVGLALLAVVAGVSGLNTLASHHGDEAAYIDVALHMRASGNYLVPVYHGQLMLDKPPLFYWLVALSFRLLGVSLFAARLPSLLGVGVLAALLYWFARRAYGSVRGAVYAVLALTSCGVTCWIERLAVPDTVMTIGVLLAIVGYWHATRAEEPTRNLGLASIGIGIAGMAKGHVGVVIAVLPLAVMIILIDRGSSRRLTARDCAAPGTWLPAVVMFGWWYIYLLSSHQAVIDLAPAHPDARQTLSEALVQFLSSEVEHQVSVGFWEAFSTNLHKYGSGLVVWFFPWTVCILAGLFIPPRPFWLDWREHRHLTAILLTAIVSIIVLFTAIVLERSAVRYVLPIAPAVAILAARYFVRREEARGRHRLLSAPVITTAGLLVFYNGLFGVFLPTAVRPPLESACAVLRARLGPSDVVLSAGLDDKWSTFAGALLDHEVVSVDQHKDIAVLVQRIHEAVARNAPRDRSVYVLTTAEAARALQASDAQRFRMIEPGTQGWAAERWQLWERFAALEVRRGGADVSGSLVQPRAPVELGH